MTAVTTSTANDRLNRDMGSCANLNTIACEVNKSRNLVTGLYPSGISQCTVLDVQI
jgi:hypothetical protein